MISHVTLISGALLLCVFLLLMFGKRQAPAVEQSPIDPPVPIPRPTADVREAMMEAMERRDRERGMEDWIERDVR